MRRSSEAMVEDGLMGVADAMEFLSMGRTALYGLMSSGRLPYVQIGRSRRIPRRAVVRLAAEGLSTERAG